MPINYCRSRYSVGDMPAIEFNMRFFDEQFRDINYR
nr:MAG TPA: portal protein [Caudoviricetes sp.]